MVLFLYYPLHLFIRLSSLVNSKYCNKQEINFSFQELFWSLRKRKPNTLCTRIITECLCDLVP